jgi:hypothetical protein
MVQNFDAGFEFVHQMDVLKAIRWCVSAWENDVTQGTIQNCWARSQCYDFGQYPRADLDTIVVDVGDRWKEAEGPITHIKEAFQDLQNRGAINQVDNIKAFIAPTNKEVYDQPDVDLVQQIADAYNPEVEEESSDEEELVPAITPQEALRCLQQLKRYEEQQEYDSSRKELQQMLRGYERELLNCQFKWKSSKQMDLRYYFSKPGFQED